jgi:hypothetical protein
LADAADRLSLFLGQIESLLAGSSLQVKETTLIAAARIGWYVCGLSQPIGDKGLTIGIAASPMKM